MSSPNANMPRTHDTLGLAVNSTTLLSRQQLLHCAVLCCGVVELGVESVEFSIRLPACELAALVYDTIRL